MPNFEVTINGQCYEIDDAADEDDAREQAYDFLEVSVEEIEDDDEEEEEEDAEDEED